MSHCETCGVDTRYVGYHQSYAIIPAALGHAAGDTVFNASLCEHHGEMFIAYRSEGATGLRLHVMRFPGGPTYTLPWDGIKFPGRCESGAFDPRLFVHRGKLHVAYVGLTGDSGYVLYAGSERKYGPTVYSQMFARLRDNLTVEEVFAPHYEWRHPDHEKNWGFFDHRGTLYAVYKPHVIFLIEGNHTHRLADFHMPWFEGGEMRGGASPVLVGREWYNWFHGWRKEKVGGQTRLIYSIGVYTFDANPPFAPRRMIPWPVVRGLPYNEPQNPHRVVFPSGAVLRDGRWWLVSAGVHDQYIAIYVFDAEAINRAMVRLV